MAAISFSGVGSGLDISSLVEQLVAAERAPTENRIARAESKTRAQLSALGSVKSALSNLQGALDKLRSGDGSSARKATVAEGAGFTASAGSAASLGSYQVEVVTLAAAHKLSSGAHATGIGIGTGTLHIQAGNRTIAVDVVDGENTPAGIVGAINEAAAGQGVVATLINADDGQHLVLTATESGSAGALRVTTSGGDGGLAALVYDPGVSTTLSETVAAADARVKIDGFERSASSNTLADLLPGVTLTLTAAEPGTRYTLDVATDNDALKTALQAFVSAYNTTNNLLRSVSAYNADSQKASTLTGDAMVRGLRQQLRNLVGAEVAELKTLGIGIDVDGTLSLDSGALDGAQAEDPALLSRLFTGEAGFGAGLDDLLGGMLDDEGVLERRTDGLNNRLKDIEVQYDTLDRRMEAVQTRYLAQFTAMDTLVAQLQSTSSFLSQQLASLQAQTQS